MQKTKFVFVSFFFYKKKCKKRKIKRKKNAKNKKLTRSHEIISQSNCSVMFCYYTTKFETGPN